MLNDKDLKQWLYRDLAPSDKVLLVLAAVAKESQVSEIVQHAHRAGFQFPKKWNLSQLLRRSESFAIRTPSGWEITEAGKQHLRDIGVTTVNVAAARIATDLRVHLTKIENPETRLFIEEAIR